MDKHCRRGDSMASILYRIYLVLGMVRIAEDDIVLDLGCGSGQYIERMCNARLVVGGDLSLDELRRAKQRVIRHNSVNLAQLDVRYLPFRKGVFTKVFIVEVLPMIQNLEPIAFEIRRVMSTGGVLILTYMRSSVNQLPLRLRRIIARIAPGFLKPEYWPPAWLVLNSDAEIQRDIGRFFAVVRRTSYLKLLGRIAWELWYELPQPSNTTVRRLWIFGLLILHFLQRIWPGEGNAILLACRPTSMPPSRLTTITPRAPDSTRC